MIEVLPFTRLAMMASRRLHGIALFAPIWLAILFVGVVSFALLLDAFR